MQFSFDKKFLLALLATGTLLLGIVWLGERTISQLRLNLDWSSHTQDVLLKLKDVRASLFDLETGQRGFLLTGEPRYLEPYQAASRLVDGELAALKRLTGDNATQQQYLARLEPLIAEKRAELKQTIDLHKSQGLDAAVAAVKTDHGKQAMDAIRNVLEGMGREETRLLALRKAAESRSFRQHVSVALALALLTGILLLVIYLLLRRELAARRRAAQAMADSHAQLQQRVEERTQALRDTGAALQNEAGARRHAQAAFEESERRYRRLVDVCPDAIWVSRGDEITFINGRAWRCWGLARRTKFSASLRRTSSIPTAAR